MEILTCFDKINDRNKHPKILNSTSKPDFYLKEMMLIKNILRIPRVFHAPPVLSTKFYSTQPFLKDKQSSAKYSDLEDLENVSKSDEKLNLRQLKQVSKGDLTKYFKDMTHDRLTQLIGVDSPEEIDLIVEGRARIALKKITKSNFVATSDNSVGSSVFYNQAQVFLYFQTISINGLGM